MTEAGRDERERPEIHLSDLGSGRLATRAFAVGSRPPRFRRPTDVVLLVVSLVVVVVTAWQIDDVGDFERTFADWLSTLPGMFDLVWKPRSTSPRSGCSSSDSWRWFAAAGRCCVTGQ